MTPYAKNRKILVREAYLLGVSLAAVIILCLGIVLLFSLRNDDTLAESAARIKHFFSTAVLDDDFRNLGFAILITPYAGLLLFRIYQHFLTKILNIKFLKLPCHGMAILLMVLLAIGVFRAYQLSLLHKTLNYGFYEANYAKEKPNQEDYRNHKWKGLINATCGYMSFSTIQFENDTTLIMVDKVASWASSLFPLDYFLSTRKPHKNMYIMMGDTLHYCPRINKKLLHESGYNHVVSLIEIIDGKLKISDQRLLN